MTTSESRRRPLWAVGSVVVALVASSCALLPPPGEAPLRYRDLIFTSAVKTANITYGNAPDQESGPIDLELDVYRPPASDPVTSRPLIVFVHGGSFCCGNRGSAEIVDQANTFARKGYVTASISYRLSNTGCTRIDAVCVNSIIDAREDAQAAVRFFRRYASTYGVDPTRIAIAGTSAGAITALNVGYEPTNPGSSGNPGFSSAVRAAVSLSGAHITSTPSSSDAPALLFHGTNDNLVPYSWAVTTRDAAEDAGLPAYLITWEGDGHVPYGPHRLEIIDLTTNFVYFSLDAGNAAR